MRDRPTVSWNDETQRWDDGTHVQPYVAANAPQPGRLPQPASGPDFEGAPDDPDRPDGGAWLAPRGDDVLAKPGPLRGLGRTTLIVSAVGAVLLVSLGIWALVGTGGESDPALRAPEAAPSAPSAQPTSTGEPTAAPEWGSPGFMTVTEDDFRIVVPARWERRVETGRGDVPVHFWTDPAESRRYVQVFPVTEEDATPLDVLTIAEKQLFAARDDFQRQKLAPVADHRGPAAELEYTYDSKEGGAPVRVVYRVFHADSTTLYGVVVSAPDHGWPEQQQILTAAVGEFTLVRNSFSGS